MWRWKGRANRAAKLPFRARLKDLKPHYCVQDCKEEAVTGVSIRTQGRRADCFLVTWKVRDADMTQYPGATASAAVRT